MVSGHALGVTPPVQPEERQRASADRPRLDEAFLFAQSIDIETYDRHKDKLRQELTLLEIDRHADMLEKFDVDASWRSQSAFYRVPRTCGSKRRLISASACSSCFSLRELCSTENGLFEPA